MRSPPGPVLFLVVAVATQGVGKEGNGYCSGFAEALRGPLPISAVKALHAVTVAFIIGHSVSKPFKLYQNKAPANKCTIAGMDTLVYETFASGIIPPAVAYAVRSGSGKIFGRANKTLRAWGTSILAVGALTLISRPSDMFVDKAMDLTLRQCYNK